MVFGRFLVLSGVLSEEDIVAASRVQQDLNASAFFVLIEEGLLTVEAMSNVRAYQRDHMVSFADALVGVGVMSEGECAKALKRIAAAKVRLGEVLTGIGKISAAELEEALERHRAHRKGRAQPKPL